MHRHSYKGRKLGRKRGARNSMIKNLATSIVLYEKIKTTYEKAKEVSSLVCKLITIGKRGDVDAIRKIKKSLSSEKAALKIVKEISPRFKKRDGGYLRILHIEPRSGDGAKMALLKFSPFEKIEEKEEEKKNEKPKLAPKKEKASKKSNSKAKSESK